MGRPRKSNHNLPQKVYLRHGAYYWVDRAGKYHHLGRVWDWEARDRWNKLLTGDVVRSMRLLDLLDAYIKHSQSRLSERTRKDYDHQRAMIATTPIAGLPPEAVTPAMIQQYLDVAAEKGRAVRGNREVQLLAAAFEWGRPREYVTRNPCVGLRNPESARTRKVSLEELDAWCAWCRTKGRGGQVVAAACELAFLCAQARAEILGLRRADLDEIGVHFVRGKTGARTCVRWSPRLRAAVAAAKALPLPASVAGTHLIVREDGAGYTGMGFSAIFQRLQVEWGETRPRFTLHDLRAAGATALLEAGKKAGDTTGHRSESAMRRHYDRRTERVGDPAA